ncbi:hypothetical protein CPB85DRAFT_1279835 [Mucidula mucida]|nr:hypothetical protein CPB85DRAFT_1279835 [Mucidula mucida]
MAWKPSFEKAMSAYKTGKYQDALISCTEAIEISAPSQPYFVYDCRSAIYEKLGRLKDALRDAKTTIDVAPTRCQGYLRAARIFLVACKFEQCLAMAELALARIAADDAKRRVEITSLKTTALHGKRRVTCHVATLPVELMAEIFENAVANDAPFVVRLSAVCKHWRDVALRTPRLWGSLTLTNRAPKRKTEIWLARSQRRIHNLTLRKTLVEPQWTPDKIVDLKWEHLRSCTLEDWDIITSLDQENLDHVVAGLEELEIHDRLFNHNRNSLLAYPYAALRSLILEGAIVNLHAIPPAPPTLQTLSVRSCPAQDLLVLLSYLSQAADLTTLTLDIPFGDFQAPAPLPEPLRREKLTTLDIVATPGALHLFSFIVMPSLQHLTITRSPRSIDDVLSSCITTTELRSLTIEACVTLALRRLPGGVTSAVLEAINRAEGEAVKCLTSLDVSHCPDVRTSSISRLRERCPSWNRSPSMDAHSSLETTSRGSGSA